MNPFSQHTFPLANAFTLRHPLTLLFLLVAVALMLTACGGPAADIPPSDAAPPAVSAESPAPNENAQRRSRQRRTRGSGETSGRSPG